MRSIPLLLTLVACTSGSDTDLPVEMVDTDGDGIPDTPMVDTDGDGIPDTPVDPDTDVDTSVDTDADTEPANPYPIPDFETGWSQRTVGGMSTHIYAPESIAHRGDGRSLLIALHGCSQTATALKNEGSWVDAAEQHGMVVAIPGAPGGGVLAGCWDYYGPSHSRSSGHAGAVVSLAAALASDADLWIDVDQVYVAGLSSGASMAMVLGCVAPDVFAGTGIVAGPTVGTTSTQIGQVATNEATASALCQSLAGSQSAAFDTQMTSVVVGTSDFVVAQDYGPLNADVMADVYGAVSGGTFDVAQLRGTNPAGSGQLWTVGGSQRVSLITATGMPHAWPAGHGQTTGGLGFVTGTGVDYAWYLGGWFNRNNLRAGTHRWVDVDGGIDPDPDTGVVDPDTDPVGTTTCTEAVGTLVDHTSRFEVHPGGYGAVDITYVELNSLYGVSTPFALYQPTGRGWYHDPDNAGCE